MHLLFIILNQFLLLKIFLFYNQENKLFMVCIWYGLFIYFSVFIDYYLLDFNFIQYYIDSITLISKSKFHI